MINKNKEVDDYISSLDLDRQKAISRLRDGLLYNLPSGFEEVISYGMIGYVVPLSVYPNGYHVKKNTPLPFINLASQKNHIGYYHMGIYIDELLFSWFVNAYTSSTTHKLDMGKSCVRIKKLHDIPFSVFDELAKKMSVNDWISAYEHALLRKE